MKRKMLSLMLAAVMFSAQAISVSAAEVTDAELLIEEAEEIVEEESATEAELQDADEAVNVEAVPIEEQETEESEITLEEYVPAETWNASGTNNTFGTATVLNLNTTVEDAIATVGDVNFYKFTLSNPGPITITFNHEVLGDNNNKWEIEVYSDDNKDNRIIGYNMSGYGADNHGNSMTKELGLPAGTYYLKIEAYSRNYSDGWSNVTYELRVNYTQSSVWETERNNAFLTADEIALNTTNYGRIMVSSDVDYYRFSLPQAGPVTITFNHEVLGDNNDKWYVDVYSDEDKDNRITRYSMSGYGDDNHGNSMTKELGLPAGTYYLKIEAYSRNYSDGWSNVTYELRVNYTQSSVWETELNNTFLTADDIAIHTTHYGRIMYSSDIDYYRFTIPQAGAYTISFNHEVLKDNNRKWTLNLYSDNKKDSSIYQFNVTGYGADQKGNYTTPVIHLSAGVYYLKIQAYSSNYAENRSNVTYSFSLNTHNLDNEWEVVNGKSYWYEGGVKQGTSSDPKGVWGDGTNRGREIYDGGSDGWYWLDAVYDGAKAEGKEVWVPYIYQEEDSWSDGDKVANANASDNGMQAYVLSCIRNKTGKWVRYDENGKMLKGWVTISGTLATLYPKQEGNTYYYDKKTGLMAKGWITIDGELHYFDEVTGALWW